MAERCCAGTGMPPVNAGNTDSEVNGNVAKVSNTTEPNRSAAKLSNASSKSAGTDRCNASSRARGRGSVLSQQLQPLELDAEFSGVRLEAEGAYARVYRCYHTSSDTTLALKCVHKHLTKKKDFFRELHYNYYLSPHPNIVNSFNVAFETDTSYVFAQELAPEGDLSAYVKTGGIEEHKAKQVAEQLAFALEFMHSKEIVHRDIRLENLLVCQKDLSKIKLGDFGSTHRASSLVKRKIDDRVPWIPPEVCKTVTNEGYEVHISQDAWQLGLVIFVLLTGSLPWEAAEMEDAQYKAWVDWLKRKTNKIPKKFRSFTPRLLRLLRRLLEPKPSKRAEVQEVYKYLTDNWITAKACDTKECSTIDDTTSEVVRFPRDSQYSDAADPVMKSYGIKTTVDHTDTDQRVCRWVLSTDTVPYKGI